MKALVLKEYNVFRLEDAPPPVPGPDDVLVRVRACGICGSDAHGMDGSTGRRIPPIIMGHEAAGDIADVGANVADWKRGDRVTFDSTIYCGACWFCRRGEINLCDRRRVLGVSCKEYRQNGAFAEYVAVPQRCLYRLPDAVSFENAAMVEPLSIALHAVSRARVRLNDAAVVVGAGVIGLMAVQALRAAGCRLLICVEPRPERRELALALGADAALDPRTDDVQRVILDRTEGRGADVAVEAVGNSAAVAAAIAALRKGGTLALIGNVSPVVELPLQSVVTREINVLGSCASCGDYPACLDLIARGAVNVDRLISAVAPLSEGAAWFERLHKGGENLLKVILRP